jgi:2-methylcitrate dehydratase PrpD
MKDGRVFTRERKFQIGHPKEPLTTAQFQEFFHKFAKGVLPKKDISKASQTILEMEKIKNVKDLMSILRTGK